MRANRLQELLARDELALTGWVSTGNALVAELLGHSGYDAVTVDLQHGMFGLDAAIACLQAVSATPAVPLARCRSNDLAEIGHLLDAGAYGIICPSIDTPEDAARFVAACRYPPRGRRSYGPTRAVLYGGPDYVAGADDTVLAMGMVESASALDHLDAILAVDGLDAVYVGPSDLAVSNGWEVPGGGPLDTELADALVHIVHAGWGSGRSGRDLRSEPRSRRAVRVVGLQVDHAGQRRGPPARRSHGAHRDAPAGERERQ